MCSSGTDGHAISLDQLPKQLFFGVPWWYLKNTPICLTADVTGKPPRRLSSGGANAYRCRSGLVAQVRRRIRFPRASHCCCCSLNHFMIFFRWSLYFDKSVMHSALCICEIIENLRLCPSTMNLVRELPEFERVPQGHLASIRPVPTLWRRQAYLVVTENAMPA